MLEVSDLDVVYHDHGAARVLAGVSLAVPAQQVVALLGPNGAGKTTALRAITGMLGVRGGSVSKGDITVFGQCVLGQSPAAIVQAGVAQVMEGRRILADLTVEENLRAGAYGAQRRRIREDMARWCERFPILGQRRRDKAGYLSGGEQQLLAIARALMSRPQLLLLDEPALGLAPRAVAEVAALIRELAGGGMAVLLVEQNAAMALDVATRGYVLESGVIVLSGSAGDLRANRELHELYLGSSRDRRPGDRQAPLPPRAPS